MRPGLCLAACLPLLLTPALALGAANTPDAAKKLDIPVGDVPEGYVKVDGFVTDWNSAATIETRALTRGEPEYDWTGPRDLSMLVKAQADRSFLYLSIEVRDNVVVGPKGRKGGDRVEIWIDGGIPAGKKRVRMIEVGLGAVPDGGKPTVRYGYPKKLARKAIDGLQADGSMRKTGYFFELALPLASLSDPPPGVEPLGIALIARDWDYDDPNEDEAAVATAPFDARKKRAPETMGKLGLPSSTDPMGSFYRSVPAAKGARVVGEDWVQVAGDARRERVALLEKWIVVAGRGVGEGDFYYYTLPHGPNFRYDSLELKDVNGDGGADFIVRYTVSHPGQIDQQFLAIYRLFFDSINLVFLAEIGNSGPGWTVTNEVSYDPKGPGGTTRITVRKPVATGVTKKTYTDVDADLITDWDKVLLPWKGTGSRTYEWQDTQFIKR
jgi:hypothetical protein